MHADRQETIENKTKILFPVAGQRQHMATSNVVASKVMTSHRAPTKSLLSDTRNDNLSTERDQLR
jgi:hypothetical protein